MRPPAPLFGRRARLRWLHPIIGGALLMPYILVGTVVVGMTGGRGDGQSLFSSVPAQFAAVRHRPADRGGHRLLPARPAAVRVRRPRPVRGGPPRRAADLAVRNRLARELHDSVGHALSAVTLQAGRRAGSWTAILTTLEDPPRIVVVTTFENDAYVYEALRAGAAGFRAEPRGG